MTNEQIWIKDIEEQDYHNELEKLVRYYEELKFLKSRLEDSSLGFSGDHNRNYRWDNKNHTMSYIPEGSHHHKGRRSTRDEVGSGFVVMEALKNLHLTIYNDLKSHPELWENNEEAYAFLMDLLKTELTRNELTPFPTNEPVRADELTSVPQAETDVTSSFPEYLRSKGIEPGTWQSWQAFKEYEVERLQPKRHQWIEKNPNKGSFSTGS